MPNGMSSANDRFSVNMLRFYCTPLDVRCYSLLPVSINDSARADPLPRDDLTTKVEW